VTRGVVVEQPGPLLTVQDLGRPGLAALGVPESGALDPGALRLANRLVGNEEGAAGLEVTLGQASLRARGALVLAVSGAPVPVSVDGRAHGSDISITVPDGALVELGTPARGLRSYVAVRGGLEREAVLGSLSTDLLSGLGTPLQAGEELSVGPDPRRSVPGVDQAPSRTPTDGVVELRVVPGPRADWFTDRGRRALLGTTWTVDQRSNRVGLRLDGPALERAVEDELPSEGTVAGALQVPGTGKPVLFLADHPVTGGYPVIAVVVTEDLPRAAQATPGQQVRLRAVSGPDLSAEEGE
jgi:biotin-dependent carboxylase-like uncharacterized protein